MNIDHINLPEEHEKLTYSFLQSQSTEELLSLSKSYLEYHRSYIKELHRSNTIKGSDVCRHMAKGIDLLLNRYYEYFSCDGCFTLCASGGYGRGIMNIGSDVDLLFLLHQSCIEKETEAAINRLLTPLWDIGLKIGHSVRDVSVCLEEAKNDPLNRTAMLDSRLLAGDKTVFTKFHQEYWEKRIQQQSHEFFQERVLDTQTRHEKYSNTVFLQEPNVKESPGGLRDYQNLIWIAQAMRGTTSLQFLVDEGTMTAKRRELLQKAFSFLHRVRNELHIQSQSSHANNILTLHLQGVVADALNYPEDNILRRIESFMKDYYQATHIIWKTTLSMEEIFNIEIEQSKKEHPFSFLQHWGNNKKDAIALEGFEIQDSLIRETDLEVFDKTPSKLLQVFRYQQQYGVGIAPKLRQLIQKKIHLIDDSFRSDTKNTSIFRSILESKGLVGSALRCMHSNNILGAYLPEFGALKYLVQHEFFHRYTADEHTLRCIDELDQLSSLNCPDSLFKKLLSKHEDPFALYLAVILHDTGRAEDIREHTDGSMIKADAVAKRFNLNGGRRKLLMFLVDHHLTFWNTATKCDLSDPNIIEDFAAKMKHESNLDSLLLFTYIDSRGTNDEGWGAWKEQLILQLYHTTKNFLKNGGDTFLQDFKTNLPTLQARLETQVPEKWHEDLAFHLNNLPARYFRYRSDESLVTHFQTIQKYLEKSKACEKSFEFAAEWLHYDDSGYSELIITADDSPQFLQKICCALTIEGLNILSADVYTRKDGVIIDIFRVCDQQFKSARTVAESGKINEHLYTLNTQKDYDPESYLITKRGFFDEEVVFNTMIPTLAYVNNELDPRSTVVEIQAVDRSGLLHDILYTLDQHGLIPIRARATTEKGAAIDWIYIKPKEGGRLTCKDKIESLEQDLQKLITHQGDGALVK